MRGFGAVWLEVKRRRSCGDKGYVDARLVPSGLIALCVCTRTHARTRAKFATMCMHKLVLTPCAEPRIERLLHHAPSNLPSTHSPDAKGWESPLEGNGRKKSQPKSPRRGRMPPWRARPGRAGDAEMLDVGTRKNALLGTEVQVDVLERARQPGLTVVKSQQEVDVANTESKDIEDAIDSPRSPAPDRVVVAPLAPSSGDDQVMDERQIQMIHRHWSVDAGASIGVAMPKVLRLGRQ